MRSWVYYIQLRAYYQDGTFREEGALYVVAIPDEEKLKDVDMECYAKEYLPQQTALSSARAYAVGTDIAIKDISPYQLAGYRKDMDLYVFKEGIGFEEGLSRVFKILLDHLAESGEIKMVEPVIDVGTPSADVMYACLKKALST
ncbi:conserved hypothetical protein [Hydrogenobacter thermophilus TK-6]|uniref:Uncharacterized protein n=1 Tax=Hydrogenobacter thermophilus (strain DSM 6534 / IAM 12695 / TK-6) TaxID=608538 RepID=D3DGJ8_HYDTT|nr:hypothetical protein [Hydrogenobacter thermophilus]ADO44885.1 conserved hypothetical protein [Hydrogenobacter thermophilus TK-6]BAI68950.1 hypothetical protein HTH_0486 [Hydrogenobacter thermophilus TK-6]